MRRRDFVTLIGGAVAALPIAARAQLTHLIPKIGWLKVQARQHTPDQLKAFREGMNALRLVEGRDFMLEERYADDDESRLPSLAHHLDHSHGFQGSAVKNGRARFFSRRSLVLTTWLLNSIA
jgi:putative tryptophan/tyrosine transport system substrate-binding protein